ncbi:hypothetical protein EB093_00655 [bacterium]|nr:hypothetical protein [bacterium]
MSELFSGNIYSFDHNSIFRDPPPNENTSESSLKKFGDVFNNHLHNILMDHLEAGCPVGARNIETVRSAYNHYQSETKLMNVDDPTNSNDGPWGSLFGSPSNTNIEHYHALSRLYATCYSQFPTESNLHVDHEEIDKINHDVWNGASISGREMNELRLRITALLEDLGV